MLKKANLSFSVIAQANGNDVNGIQFSTQDRNSAKLIFTIKEGKQPLNLTDIDGEITLVMQDKSRFIDKVEVTKPLDGVLEYTLTQEQIRHAGRAQGEIKLTDKDGSSIGGLRFNFTIKKALMDEDLGPVKEFYINDLEAVKQEVQEKADAINTDIDSFKENVDQRTTVIEETITQLEEGVTESVVVQVETAKKDTTGQTHADLDSRIKADVGRVTTQAEDTSKQLDEANKKIPWLSLEQYDKYKVAVSDGWDYGPSLTKLISDLPSSGGEILISNKIYGLYSTVIFDKSVTIRGLGYSSIIRGSGTLKTDSDLTHTLIVENVKLINTSNNTLLSIDKTWSSSSHTTFELTKTWFHSESNDGVLLDIYGARESSVSKCWFSSKERGNAKGILIRADVNGGAMNLHIENCQFLRLLTGIEGAGLNGSHHLLAGIRMTGNMLIGMTEGIVFRYADYVTVDGGMMDYVQKPIRFDHVVNTKIRDGYYAVSGEGNSAIEMKMSPVGKEMHWMKIHGNRIFSYAATNKGHGIVIDSNGGNITYGTISDNDFDLVDRCIYLKGSNTGRTMNLKIKGNKARSSGSFVYIDTNVENNDIEENYCEASVGVFVSNNNPTGGNRISKGNRYGIKRSSNKGKIVASGDGANLIFSANHNLFQTANHALITLGSSAIRNIPYHVTYDAEKIYINFATAPPLGTNNVIINWEAEI